MKIKIAYIGGGSKAWARIFMHDLALQEGLFGEIALYDIDRESAERNRRIGEKINIHERTKTAWTYRVYDRLEDALIGADVVGVSILPGDMEWMHVDVHHPEKYGIFQSVGDSVGPGGVIRAMRSVPIFMDFARKIAEYAPHAWVINFTNPMSILVKTLHDVAPEIKVFGCCHEVFHTQDFLIKALEAQRGIRVGRKDIQTDVSGVNHFTWITKATYREIDLLSVLKAFWDAHPEGYNEKGEVDEYLTNPFACANKVKMDLFMEYGVLAAAGDRHLAEFFSHDRYLASTGMAHHWKFNLTDVCFRIQKRDMLIERQIAEASGKEKVCPERSDEEAVDIIQALMGQKELVTNVNIPNSGHMPGVKDGAIVETNAHFTRGRIIPIPAHPLPWTVRALVNEQVELCDMLYQGIKDHDLERCFQAFSSQPLIRNLSKSDKVTLFRDMVYATRTQLMNHFEIDRYFGGAR
ncbi:MAG: alpha-glucosidase/alpha-galactosidase [Candidatus Izemoplasmatales bacterium]|nr:alpha-glucosidase/alpha-galactosidase [Candidatus Izemoplasmatales bacterium]